MKIILSRKGMDSSYGGHPSIIIDDKLISLPIPSSCNKCTYSEIQSGYNDYSMYELITKTTNKIKINNWVLITKETQCHLDPDIVFEHLNRQVDWKGSLGQVGAAQTVLKKMKFPWGIYFCFLAGLGNIKIWEMGLHVSQRLINILSMGIYKLEVPYIQIKTIFHNGYFIIPM